jgi:uncharacterized membrane protein
MPITFLISASLSDILTHVAQEYPKAIEPLAAQLSTPVRTLIQFTTLFSYFLTLAALFTAVPAVLSGGQQAVGMISSRGLKARSVQTTLLHAVLMDVAIAGAAYNWYSRKDVTGFMSEKINLAISGATLLAVLYSSSLGGKLVYEHGIGVSKVGAVKKAAAAEKKKA